MLVSWSYYLLNEGAELFLVLNIPQIGNFFSHLTKFPGSKGCQQFRPQLQAFFFNVSFNTFDWSRGCSFLPFPTNSSLSSLFSTLLAFGHTGVPSHFEVSDSSSLYLHTISFFDALNALTAATTGVPSFGELAQSGTTAWNWVLLGLPISRYLHRWIHTILFSSHWSGMDPVVLLFSSY